MFSPLLLVLCLRFSSWPTRALANALNNAIATVQTPATDFHLEFCSTPTAISCFHVFSFHAEIVKPFRVFVKGFFITNLRVNYRTLVPLKYIMLLLAAGNRSAPLRVMSGLCNLTKPLMRSGFSFLVPRLPLQ
jgi:hypothetical protein